MEPRISNHGIPLIYFSKKRENTLVYLSNAIEKYCKENNYSYDGIWQKWGSYGFEKDGRLRIEEYYPNALLSTYKGVSGYIYRAEHVNDSGYEVSIPDAITSNSSVLVSDVEFVVDAYEAILQAEKQGLITILHYDDVSENMRKRLYKMLKEEYKSANEHPEYRFFLEKNFPEIDWRLNFQ